MKNLTPCSTDAAQQLAHITCSIALLLEVQPSFKLQNDRTFYSRTLYIIHFYTLYLNKEAKLVSDVAHLESYTIPACKGGCIKAVQQKVEGKCSGEWRRRWSSTSRHKLLQQQHCIIQNRGDAQAKRITKRV